MNTDNYNNILNYLTNQQHITNLTLQQQQQIQKQSKHYKIQYNLLYKLQPKTSKLIRIVKTFEKDPVLYAIRNFFCFIYVSIYICIRFGYWYTFWVRIGYGIVQFVVPQ